MFVIKIAFLLLGFAALSISAKPSHPFGLQAIPDHFDFAPPVLPPVPFHGDHTHFLPPAPVSFHAEHTQLIPPAAAQVFHAAPAPVFHAGPAPVFHTAPLPYLPAAPVAAPVAAPLFPAPVPAPAPAHFLPSPAPLWPAPAPLLPAPLPVTKVLPPVYEAIPFAASYRAIPGPKTTTHHVSVGYAYPTTHFAKLVAPASHAHLHAAPLSLSHHQHHSLF